VTLYSFLVPGLKKNQLEHIRGIFGQNLFKNLLWENFPQTDNGIFVILRKATGGEAVVIYREPSATKEIPVGGISLRSRRIHRFSRRVNKTDIKLQNSYLTIGRDIKNCSNRRMTH
jgi:hypothetical protein